MAQTKQHANWKINSVRLSEDEAMITFHAVLDSGWHLYAQHVRVNEAALKFTFEESKNFALVETVREDSKSIFRFDPVLNLSAARFEKYASFSQRIKLSQSNAIVNGSVHFTVGSDTGQPVKEVLHFSVAVSVKNTKEKVAVN
jgi:hypothetical protein